MRRCVWVLAVTLLWPMTAAQAQAQELTAQEQEAIQAALEQLEYRVSESLAAEVRDRVLGEDQSYECNVFVAAVAQGVAIRSGGTNLIADAVGAYCAGAEVATWLREWYARALEQMMWIRVAMALNWQFHYGGFLWQFFA